MFADNPFVMFIMAEAKYNARVRIRPFYKSSEGSVHS